jgi:hypothetical protein
MLMIATPDHAATSPGTPPVPPAAPDIGIPSASEAIAMGTLLSR